MTSHRHKRSLKNYFNKYYELEYNPQKAGNLNRLEKITALADICLSDKRAHKMQSTAKRHIGGEPFTVLLGDSITRGHIPCTKQLIDV